MKTASIQVNITNMCDGPDQWEALLWTHDKNESDGDLERLTDSNCISAISDGEGMEPVLFALIRDYGRTGNTLGLAKFLDSVKKQSNILRRMAKLFNSPAFVKMPRFVFEHNNDESQETLFVYPAK